MTQMELPYPNPVTRIRRASLAWVDIETTGLDPATDQMLEIGVIVTDDNLIEIDSIEFVIDPGDDLQTLIASANPYVQNLHVESGLWMDIPKVGVDIHYAESKVFSFLYDHDLNLQRSPMAGSSVAFDRAFIDRYMPTVGAAFHYRNLDVSAIKEWYSRVVPHAVETRPAPAGNHRVLSDLRDSIKELRHYTTFLKENS